MPSTTFTVRVDATAKRRLEKLARSTGRSRSFLAAEALDAYLDVNEWQVEGIEAAVRALDGGEGVGHDEVKRLVGRWRGKAQPRAAKRAQR
jgi:predicted transcriptional regulator